MQNQDMLHFNVMTNKDLNCKQAIWFHMKIRSMVTLVLRP